MKRTAALVAMLVTLGSCEFAVKHPAITAGITGGVIAEGTCEIGTGGEHLACAGISGGVAVGLAGIVALAILLGGNGDTILHGEDPEDPPAPDVPQDPTLDQPVKVPPAQPAPQPSGAPGTTVPAP
jgi:hypothetical protein